MRGRLPWEARNHLKSQVGRGKRKDLKKEVNSRNRYERSTRLGGEDLEYFFKPLAYKGMETIEKLDRTCGGHTEDTKPYLEGL